jgi:hypothetical protein
MMGSGVRIPLAAPVLSPSLLRHQYLAQIRMSQKWLRVTSGVTREARGGARRARPCVLRAGEPGAPENAAVRLRSAFRILGSSRHLCYAGRRPIAREPAPHDQRVAL